jgi:hypothetical protein
VIQIGSQPFPSTMRETPRHIFFPKRENPFLSHRRNKNKDTTRARYDQRRRRANEYAEQAGQAWGSCGTLADLHAALASSKKGVSEEVRVVRMLLSHGVYDSPPVDAGAPSAPPLKDPRPRPPPPRPPRSPRSPPRVPRGAPPPRPPRPPRPPSLSEAPPLR